MVQFDSFKDEATLLLLRRVSLMEVQLFMQRISKYKPRSFMNLGLII